LALQNILFTLDTPVAVPLNAQESYIKGWFANSGNPYRLWLQVGDRQIQAFTGFERPDVARVHGNRPEFKNSGFLVRFERPQPGSTVALKAFTEAGEVVLADGITAPDFSGAANGHFEPGTDASYRNWLVTAEPSLYGSDADLQSRLSSFGYQPLISILLALPEAHPYFLTRSIESVIQQRYPHWQLCIACAASGAAHEHAMKVAREDSRIQVKVTEEDGTSEDWRTILVVAEGDFVLPIDYQDELHPFALIEIVSALNTDGPFDLVYTDEDEIDLFGNRLRCFFKPDFDAEALLSWNFVGKGAAFRRAILLNSSSEWDALLRMLETPETLRVHHVPRPLYHSRQHESRFDDCPGVSSAAIRSHIARTGKRAHVEPGIFPGSFRVKYEKQANRQIAVFVRAEDGSFQHAAVAPNINPKTSRVYELLGHGADLLDHNAQNVTMTKISRPIARSLAEMPEDVFIFINRPLETVNHFFLEELADQAMRQDCGLVTGISLDRTSRILHSGFRRDGERIVDEFAGFRFSEGELLRKLSVVHSVDAISDEFFAVKRHQIEALGGFKTIFSTRMPEVVTGFIHLARSENTRILVTPYSIATFDLISMQEGMNTQEPMPESITLKPQDALEAAQNERRLAAAQLREIASERNHLHRKLILLEESIARLRTNEQIESLQRQIQTLHNDISELKSALAAERRLREEILNSVSWKLTNPLRACMRFVKRKS
jgi:hypothetical protein